MNAQLLFSVKNQIIHREDDFEVVADSQNYLRARFDFITNEWDGLIKTALFRNGMKGTVYEVILQNDECLIPHEVLSGNEKFVYVSVFAGELITVNKEKIYVEDSGYWGDAESSTEPTPSVYQQIINRLEGVEDVVVESAESALESANSALQSKEDAEQSATIAVQAAESASESAQAAEESADRSEQAARNSGYVAFHIDENGHLIYTKTDGLDIDFEIKNGRLIYYV